MSRLHILQALVCCFASAVPAYAQVEPRGFANFIVSGTTIEGSAALGLTGGFGYRLNRTLIVGIELTRLPSYDPDVPEAPPFAQLTSTSSIGGIIIQPPSYSVSGEGGRGTIFTANARLDIPTPSRRLVPYVIGGAGVASLHEEFTVTITYATPIFQTVPGFPPTRIFPPPVSYEVPRSTTDFAATLGGGLEILVGDHLTFDADVRYLGVLGSRDLNLGRFGLGIGYRF
jgi:opacity protein-like surface antigen